MHICTSDQRDLDLGFGGYSCNWGTHFGGLYETEQERDDILFGFLHEGDLRGDLQLYCPVERSIEEFKTEYTGRYPDCNGHEEDPERFSIHNARDLYYPDGKFSPGSMDRALDLFYVQSQRKGEKNVRATAEMAWAIESIPGVEHLMVYESRLNYFILGKPWISICLYNLNVFPGTMIMQVLQTHPFLISGGVIIQNQYYEKPEIWLKKNAPGFLGDDPD